MKKIFALGLVGLLATSANAGFTSGPHNGVNSASAIAAPGSANSAPIIHNHAGPAFIPGSFTVAGTLTNGGVQVGGTYASEARFRVTSPGGQVYNSAAHIGTTEYGAPLVVPSNTQTLPAAFQTNGPGNSVGNWSFAPHESFDDFGAGTVDQSWDNLTLAIGDLPPPPPAFAGNFTGTPNSLTVDNKVLGTTIWNHLSPQPGLTDGAGQLATTGRYPGFGWDLVGNEVAYEINHAGGFIDLALTGLTADLDLVLLDSSGLIANTVEVSDGFSGSASEFISLPFLAAGTYYAVVDSFGTGAGSNYSLTYTPEPASLALLGLGALAIVRRRR